MSKQLNVEKGQLISEVIVPFTSRLIEMVTDATTTDVPIDPRIDMGVILADDPDPKFVNVEVMRARTSGNSNRYNNGVVKEVTYMIPGVQAFLGHPDPSKYGFEFREPQGIYVGAIIETLGDGMLRSVAKCYLFTTSPLREWVPKSIAAGVPMTVSINGTADVIRNDGYNDVIHMTKLDSIDWANPGTEGMDTSKALSVVREQQQNNNTGGSVKMDGENAKQIIQNVTVAELKAYNKDSYDAIIKSTTVQELQSLNPTVVSQISESAKVTEMQFTIGSKVETVKVAELQQKFDSYEQKVTELQGKLDGQKLDAYKTKKIGELIPENLREMVTGRVTGKTETEIDASIDTEIKYIREMTGGNANLPLGQQQQQSSDSVREHVYEMFGNKPKQK